MPKNAGLILALLVLALSAPGGFAGAPEAPPAPAPQNDGSFFDSETLTGYLLGKGNSFDAAYDATQKWKEKNHFPLYIGADHWWHVDRDDRVYGNGYGVPGERGTYYYYAEFDPSLTFTNGGFVREIGAHVQARFRDGSEKLRSFYRNTAWTYEDYAYAKTAIGDFKAGEVALEFGYVWDNSWWEGVPYFDGYRFNPAYGFSWDKAWKASKTLTVATSAQFFISDDRVSGAIAGADAESSLAGERNTIALRVAPTWKPSADWETTVGASFLTREVEDPDRFGKGLLDDRQTVWSVDGSVSYKKLTLFSQYTDSHGAISPARYVSGGPSDRQNSVEVGFNWKLGPISPHLNYSYGWDHHPDGHQFIFNPGVAIAVAKSLTVYTEYVKWDVVNTAGSKAIFDDGFELIAVWNY